MAASPLHKRMCSMHFLVSLLLVASLTADVVSATRSLSLSLTGPKTAVGVDALHVVATVTNTGDEELKLLNDPHSPLSTVPTDTFAITGKDGSGPSFHGIKVKYVPSKVASIEDSSVFTVLAPGESTSITHDLSTIYNFTRSGEGSYTFEARRLFYHIADSEAMIPIYAHTEPTSFALAGNLVVTRPSLDKREDFTGCSLDQKTDIQKAVVAAAKYAGDATLYANLLTAETPRYTTWFGEYNSSRHHTVVDHFSNIFMNGEPFSSYTFDCSTCTYTDVYAYVYPDKFGKVYLCGAFWQAPSTGQDSKAGTLVHESSHFLRNGGTHDHVYGQEGCKTLAKTDPGMAVDNADSHEYFAENSPFLP